MKDSAKSGFYWLKDAWNIAKPYWKSSNKFKAISLLVATISFNLMSVYITVLINQWYNRFYASIQQYNKKAFISSLYLFSILAFIFIFFQICASLIRKFLEIDWRKWLTAHYIDKWFTAQSYYKARFLENTMDNPDQRISDDINDFIALTLDLTLGLINSLVTLLSFITILWTISGSLPVHILGHYLNIKGYLVYIALIYTIVGTYITFKIGRPIIRLNFLQQRYEADFRYNLVRVREYSENIAFYHGEQQESKTLLNKFTTVVNNFVTIIYRQMKIDIFTNMYAQIAIVFPFIVASSRYFAKVIQLGDLMQINSAFARVQDSLSFFLSSYNALANWRAVMDRLNGFQYDLDNIKQLPATKLDFNNTNFNLSVTNLEVLLPNNIQIIGNLNFALGAGDKLLIIGKSGKGKTTLLRALSGIWPFYKGTISRQKDSKVLFVGQKPYMPQGTLRRILCYPLSVDCINRDNIADFMKLCDLSEYVSKLDDIKNWDSSLSLGEQQKISFCRILLNQPDIIFLDESTSALDEESESLLYWLLDKYLKNATVISVGHRTSIIKWHNHLLNVDKSWQIEKI